VTATPGDVDTDRCVVVETRRSVAGLTPAVQQGLARAAASRRTFVLLSMVDTRLTPPLHLALRARGCRWVVSEGRRGSGRRCYDGFTGMPVRWDGAAWVDDGEAPPLSPPRPGGPGWLEIDAETVSPARADLVLGRPAEAVAAAAGLDLAGWGRGEPVPRRWSPDDLTREVRDRLPRPTGTVVIGRSTADRSLAGLLEVTRVRGGMREHLRAVVGMPAEPPPDAVRGYVTRLADAGARSALFGWQSGRADGCRTALPHPPALPLGALLGSGSPALDAVRADGDLPIEDLPGGSGWVSFGLFPYRDLARLTALVQASG
jgi:hypothetical protein